MEVQWCIHQGREGFSGQSRGKQCSFINLSALLTAQTIPVIEWNSTTIDNALGQGDNMYLNAFNNDLIPREGISVAEQLTITNCSLLSTGFALVYVDRFISTFALFLSSSCVSCFSMSTSTGLRFHAFYVCAFPLSA